MINPFLFCSAVTIFTRFVIGHSSAGTAGEQLNSFSKSSGEDEEERQKSGRSKITRKVVLCVCLSVRVSICVYKNRQADTQWIAIYSVWQTHTEKEEEGREGQKEEEKKIYTKF